MTFWKQFVIMIAIVVLTGVTTILVLRWWQRINPKTQLPYKSPEEILREKERLTKHKDDRIREIEDEVEKEKEKLDKFE